jgi:hypothetical protein
VHAVGDGVPDAMFVSTTTTIVAAGDDDERKATVEVAPPSNTENESGDITQTLETAVNALNNVAMQVGRAVTLTTQQHW